MPLVPEDTIATSLQTAGLGTVETDIFKTSPKDGPGFPNKCIFITSVQIDRGQTFLGNQNKYKRNIIQIVSRGVPNNERAPEDVAKLIIAALDLEEVSPYTVWESQTDRPIRLGPDAQGRFMWSANILVEYLE